MSTAYSTRWAITRVYVLIDVRMAESNRPKQGSWVNDPISVKFLLDHFTLVLETARIFVSVSCKMLRHKVGLG